MRACCHGAGGERGSTPLRTATARGLQMGFFARRRLASQRRALRQRRELWAARVPFVRSRRVSSWPSPRPSSHMRAVDAPPTWRACVFASASPETPHKYMAAASALGRALAAAEAVCVNGGGKFGCMGALNDSLKAAGGRVCGVIAKLLKCALHQSRYTTSVARRASHTRRSPPPSDVRRRTKTCHLHAQGQTGKTTCRAWGVRKAEQLFRQASRQQWRSVSSSKSITACRWSILIL